jgi:predicted membrane protein
MNEERKEMMRQRFSNSRRWSGLVLVIIGGLLLAQKMGAPLPRWLFTWQVLLIAIGIFIGIRRKFRDLGWLFPIFVGGFFLVADFYPQYELNKYTLPIIIMMIGLAFVLRPRNRGFRNCQPFVDEPGPAARESTSVSTERFTANSTGGSSADDYLDVTSVLGGIKKNVFSKNFKGGEATSFLGGTELNLSQADINGSVVLELTQVLGGTKLIVPSHWDVKTELVSVFGGIEDKRILNGIIDPTKVLVLKGTSVFGGIEIRSY